MTKRGRHYLCKILVPPMPPSHDATVLNYLNDRARERAPLYFVGFWRPPPQTPQYLTILVTERDGAPLSFVGFWRPPMPPSKNAKILNYLIDREKGRYYLL